MDKSKQTRKAAGARNFAQKALEYVGLSAALEAQALHDALKVYTRALETIRNRWQAEDPLSLREQVEERVPSAGAWPVWGQLYAAHGSPQKGRALSKRLDRAICELKQAVQGQNVQVDPGTLGDISWEVRSYLDAREKAQGTVVGQPVRQNRPVKT